MFLCPPPAAGNTLDSVEDGSNVSIAPEKVSPAGESENNNAEDAYAFTCGQDMPDSQVSFLSPPVPSPEVSEPGCSLLFLKRVWLLARPLM